MANRYQSDDRFPRRYGRAYQEEQFESEYDENRPYGQMGDSWNDYRQPSSWQSDQRYDRGSRSAEMYSRYPGEPPRRFDRYTGSDFQSRDRDTGRDRTSEVADRARDAFAYGAGSRLAAAHGEWHDPNDYGTRSYSSYRGRDNGRNFFERAGDEIASWFEGDERGRHRGYRGHGPSGYTRSDERIREDANDRLTEDYLVDARNITLTVENGEVTLNGTVGSRDQKRRAEDCVEDITGVKHVQNNLRVQDRTGWERETAYDPARSEGNTTTGNI